MKRHQTSGAALLRIARAVLKDDLLPTLPRERRLEALMVLSALGMAERELENAAPEDETGAIAGLLGTATGDKPDLRRRLAEAIRAGRFDGSTALFELARSGLEWRLRETDPRVVDKAEAKT
ncbi:MAG: DUF6285 domain-containing protein [Kiloniellales bacterium]|nr:DUF6285 domain-containing protein [Kiloniellales bacterium]